MEARLSGQEADFHELPAYDGFSSLAGLSLATTIITHYAATGRLRRKGQFETRSRVRFKQSRRGSLIFGLVIDFVASNPFILGITGGVISSAVYDLLKTTINRTVGLEAKADTNAVKNLLEHRVGDLEALSAAIEPSLRQAHSIIGNGAHTMQITGRADRQISTFNKSTKDYIIDSINDEEPITKDVSVAAFNANSGHGRVFDEELGRTVAIYIPEHAQNALKSVIGWGLNEYARGTGRKVSITFTRVMALDGRPKKYIVLEAERGID